LFGSILAAYAPIAFVSVYLNRVSWAILAENMTKNMRGFLYSSLLRKDIGWFDHKQNSAGQLTSVLATEVQTLNGVSVESIGVGMEAGMAMLIGMIIAFIFAWKVALVSLAIAPLMMIGSFL
jgi:ATP-binding cassette, subfamily B (MDR/TAP), member 1